MAAISERSFPRLGDGDSDVVHADRLATSASAISRPRRSGDESRTGDRLAER